MDRNSSKQCSDYDLAIFSKNVSWQLMQLNALMAMNSILMGIIVGFGAYCNRYRHHPLTCSLFTWVTPLFLPIVSYVASIVIRQNIIDVTSQEKILLADCSTYEDYVLVWTALVQIVGINTTVIVASDAREGRNITPPMVLIVQAIWTSYLAITTSIYDLKEVFSIYGLVVLSPCALIFAKLLFKCYAWWKAKRSFGLGRNPRLIVGYMEQLQDRRHRLELTSDHIPPPLILMGEETVLVEKKPCGYSFKWMSNTSDSTRVNNNSLLTIDNVWQLDDVLLSSTTQLKDLCFSFTLFKLLRCRFARYTAAEAGFMKAYNFLRHILIEERDDERILVMVADELSFLQDYYYSSLPVSYSKSCLPILSIFLSLTSIGYCFLTLSILAYYDIQDRRQGKPLWQMTCFVQCNAILSEHNTSGTLKYFGPKHFGNTYFILVPIYLLSALVVLAEGREIASYICSNWTKVALICHYVNHDSWRKSLTMQKCIGRVLQCRCKMLKHWKDKMNQCSIMVVHPRKTPVALLRGLIPLPDQNNKIQREVKLSIIDALRRHERSQQNIGTSLQRSMELQVGDNILWTLNEAKGIADTILVCQIATNILEVRSHPHQSPYDHKIAAIHLSRYCVYLVAYCPELLPEDDKWCKSLYKEIKKDAKCVLADGIEMSTPEVEYEKLIRRLRAESNHEILKNGAKLGERLVDLVEGEATAWRVLASFWSEMILYLAPSDNINGHAEAIARGGELITLVWALLTHLGIVNKPDDTAAGTTDGAPVVV